MKRIPNVIKNPESLVHPTNLTQLSGKQSN